MEQDAKEEYLEELKNLSDTIEELFKVKEQSIGRPVVDYAAQAELMKVRKRYEPLAAMHTANGEKRACLVFDWMYTESLLPDCIPIDNSSMKRELRFKTGRKVDRAIFHESGRLSLIEIKDCCDQRSVVAGIGQALLYSALAEKEYPSMDIVPVLAVLGKYDADVARACKRGNVEYIPLGDVKYLMTLSQLVGVLINVWS